jgi:hypothetical protein
MSMEATRTAVVLGWGEVAIVGEGSYQRDLEEIAGGKKEEGVNLLVLAALVPEPDNPYDRNAIAVQIDERTVGYLDREKALAYQPVAKRLRELNAIGLCIGRIRGGWRRPGGDEGHFGVVIHLAPPDKALP